MIVHAVLCSKQRKANKLSELAIRFRKVAEHCDIKALSPFSPGCQRIVSVQSTLPLGEPIPDTAALAEFWSGHFGQIEGATVRVPHQEFQDSYVEHAPCLDELASVH